MSPDVPGGQNLPDAELLSYEVSKADKWAEGIAKQAECKRSIKKTGLAQGQWPGGKVRGRIPEKEKISKATRGEKTHDHKKIAIRLTTHFSSATTGS